MYTHNAVFLSGDGEYIVARITNYKDIVESKIIHRCKTLKEANQFLVEDGVPGNAAGAGNIASIGIGDSGEPPGIIAAQRKKKKRNHLFKRFAPMLNVKT